MSATATRTVHVGIDGTTWWNDCGFGRFTRGIIEGLLARDEGFSYTLLIDREPDESLPANLKVLRVPTASTVTESAVGSGSRSLRDLWALRNAAAAARFDLFFFPAVYSYFPLAGRTPCIVAFHDTIAERYPELLFPTRRNRWLWRAKVRLALARASRVMTVSQASARDVESLLGVTPGRIDVVSEAPDARFQRLADPAIAETVRATYGVPAGAPLLIYVGGLNPHKNLMGLLRAFDRLVHEPSRPHLAIVGDTSGRGFHDNVSELKDFVQARPALAAAVHFTGYVSEEELVALYNGADALVLPSFWEGFGLPAVEAMACGLPVLASRRGSLPEVIGEAGALFDPASVDDMVKVIAEFLADPALARRLRQSGLERAATFTWNNGAALAEAAFRRALSS